MTGWLVNDRLTAIEGTRTFWHQLLDGIEGLVEMCRPYPVLAQSIEMAIQVNMSYPGKTTLVRPDYIIRNAAYFRWLDVPCPVISFVQDVLQGDARTQLLDACAASRLIVFNSEYTRARYPELRDADSRIIPIGTDEEIFRFVGNDPNGPVMWVGSGHPVKRFHLACELARQSYRPWAFVMKDDTPIDVPGAIVFRSIPQDQLPTIARGCSVGVCTSVVETQHLAGIEMGFCGLPLVTSNVGIYFEREAGDWGRRSEWDWLPAIEAAAQLDSAAASRYWRAQPLSVGDCVQAWKEAVDEITVAHGVR